MRVILDNQVLAWRKGSPLWFVLSLLRDGRAAPSDSSVAWLACRSLFSGLLLFGPALIESLEWKPDEPEEGGQKGRHGGQKRPDSRDNAPWPSVCESRLRNQEGHRREKKGNSERCARGAVYCF